MRLLSIPLPSLRILISTKPVSSAYIHNTASPTPTLKSLPVGQHTRIFASSGALARKGASKGSSVRKAREPSFPGGQWRGR